MTNSPECKGRISQCPYLITNFYGKMCKIKNRLKCSHHAPYPECELYKEKMKTMAVNNKKLLAKIRPKELLEKVAELEQLFAETILKVDKALVNICLKALRFCIAEADTHLGLVHCEEDKDKGNLGSTVLQSMFGTELFRDNPWKKSK